MVPFLRTTRGRGMKIGPEHTPRPTPTRTPAPGPVWNWDRPIVRVRVRFRDGVVADVGVDGRWDVLSEGETARARGIELNRYLPRGARPASDPLVYYPFDIVGQAHAALELFGGTIVEQRFSEERGMLF